MRHLTRQTFARYLRVTRPAWVLLLTVPPTKKPETPHDAREKRLGGRSAALSGAHVLQKRQCTDMQRRAYEDRDEKPLGFSSIARFKRAAGAITWALDLLAATLFQGRLRGIAAFIAR
jgi:hypothetical protein